MKDWLPIEGFPGYTVNAQGEIKGKFGKILKLKKAGPDKRPMVCLTNRLFTTRGKPIPGTEGLQPRKYIYVSIVVCTAFHGPKPFEHYQAAHINGDFNDNRSTNLMWASPRENAQHKFIHGTQPMGENNPQTTLTEVEVKDIRAALDSGVLGSVLAEKYKVSRGTITHIKNRQTWGHV